MEKSVAYSAEWEDDNESGSEQESGMQNDIGGNQNPDDDNVDHSETVTKDEMPDAAVEDRKSEADQSQELEKWLDVFTKGILEQALAGLARAGLLAESDENSGEENQSEIGVLEPETNDRVAESETKDDASQGAEEQEEPVDKLAGNDESDLHGEHLDSRDEVDMRTRSFLELPSVVTWTLHPSYPASPRKFSSLPSVVTWLPLARIPPRFSSLPSVVTWLPPARNPPFSSLPSVVTWIWVPKPANLLQRSSSHTQEWIDAFDDAEDVTDENLDETEESDPDRLDVVLDEREEIQVSEWAAEVSHVALSPDEAALRLQRTCRGMLDRKFFRKYRAKVARHNQPANMRRTAKVTSTQSLKVTMPAIEADGYLSKATVQKMQSRGKPLDFAKVEETYEKVRNKPHVTFQIQGPGQDAASWHVGESKSIKWKTVGNIEVVRVGLYLYKDGDPVHTIVKAVPNSGKYIFSLPETISPGDDCYQILVIAEQPKMPHVHSFTSPFSVSERKAGMLARVPTSVPKLISTFPSRPGWSWIAGSTNMITWTSEGVVQNVSVDILRHGKLAIRLSGSCLNVGAFQFPMPLDTPFGEGFQIRVRCTTNKAAFCLSYPFSIIDRQVALAVPRRAPKGARKKEFTASSSLPDLSQSRLLKPLGPPSTASSQDLSGGQSWGAATMPNGRLAAPSANTSNSTFSLSKSLPNSHGLSAISFDSSVPSQPGHPDFESRVEDDGNQSRLRRSGSRSPTSGKSFSSPYFAGPVLAGRRRNDGEETPYDGRNTSFEEVDNSVERWAGSDMDRFTERGERALRERVSTGRLMASALSPMERSRKAKPRSKTSMEAGPRRGGWRGGVDSGGEIGGRRPITKTQIISGAEEFLEMRDRMLEEQMAGLQAMFSERGGENQGGGARYVPALLPDLRDRNGRQSGPPRSAGQKEDSFRKYERARIRDGTPSTAITEYMDAVQERIFGLQAEPAR